MTLIFAYFLVVVYGFSMFFIFAFNVWQGYLVFLFYKYKQKPAVVLPKILPQNLPVVTVQLPIYNEMYVVARLLNQVMLLNYPKNKLEIQLLDDSTDQTTEIAAKIIAEMRLKGIDIQHIRRKERTGYKAGALAEGLGASKGEFLAIFDADFLPQPDFLLEMLPMFYENEKIGLVQSRWGHINEADGWLTRLQAFFLNAHFTVEHLSRKQGGGFINFNGSGGIWRKTCIIDAGGWSADTLTEDLDLSYRAQLKGWAFGYMPQVTSPAELPANINALKSQQHRWNKGAAECVRKNLLNVLKNKQIGYKTKLHAIFHLGNSSIFLCIAVGAICSLPLFVLSQKFVFLHVFFRLGSFFLCGFFLLIIFFWTSYEAKPKNFLRFLGRFVGFISVSMGLSLYNSIAVLEGYLGIKTPFVRTPKFSQNKDINPTENVYLSQKFPVFSLLEFAFALYFAFGIWLSFYFKDYSLLIFYVLLCGGFGVVSLKSVFQFLNKSAT